MEYPLKTLSDCRRCTRTLVTKKCWVELPKSVRKEMKSEFAGACGRGLCFGCYAHAEATDTLMDYERKTMPMDIFVEEYVAMKESGMTNHHIAEKLGMLNRDARWPSAQLSTLNKAIKRAEKAGLL